MTVGRWLTPERIKPDTDLTEAFDVGAYLARVGVTEDSPLVGRTVEEAVAVTDVDLDVL